MDDVVVERVLRAVEQVPRGRVVAYGDIAALVGVGPRLVGRVMSTYG
ncbi:MAG: MGMT family protein, partial [Dermatophilaceae bacterium]